MKNPQYYDEKMIRTAIATLKPNNELFEIRMVAENSGRSKIIDGYFTDADTLIKALDTVEPRGYNVYISVNKVNDDCYAREQHNCLRATDRTTSDNEIDSYEWLFIDLDPVRIAKISSNDDELNLALQTADSVKNYLKSIGFSEPVQALSGNGAHLLYRIDLKNTEENKNLIEKCLRVLADQFNSEKIKVDESNHNQSRVCKLYGTLAQKGAHTSLRPHRMSKILKAPDEIVINSKEILLKLANELPDIQVETKSSKSRSTIINKTQFDIEEWMSQYGLEYTRKESSSRATIYPLKSCPFDSSHKNGDSKIFLYADGAIAFKCHHNSCIGKNWQDVREKFEPGVYDQDYEEDNKQIDEGWARHKKQQQYLVVQKTNDIEQVKKSLPKISAISAYDLQQKVFEEKYYAVKDMVPEGETIIAAPPKTGKSWLVLDMCLKVAEGEPFLGFETDQADTLYLALEDGDSFEQERLNIVLKGKEAPKNFHLVFSDVMPMNEGFLLQLDELLKSYPRIKVIVIDTLNFIKYRQGKSESAYECDYRTGRDLKQFAEEHKLAIVVVTHTTKAINIADDMANVSGTNGVTGAADSVIVISKDKRTDKEAKLFITGRKVKQNTYKIKFNDENCGWEFLGLSDQEEEDSKQKQRENEYFQSDVRRAVVTIASRITEPVRLKAGELVEKALEYGIGIKEGNKEIGGFLSSMQGLFKAIDDIYIEIIKNGTGSRIYRINPLITENDCFENPFENVQAENI